MLFLALVASGRDEIQSNTWIFVRRAAVSVREPTEESGWRNVTIAVTNSSDRWADC